MGIVGRFTRDEVSAKVWWPLALLVLVLFVLTFPGENRAVEDARETYTTFPSTVAFSEATFTDDVRETWLLYRITLGAGLLVTMFFALLSIREPKARIGAGVPFYPENVPPYLSLIDADEAEQLRQLGSYARRRVGDLQGPMESEKMALEGEVQRLLSAAAAKGLFHAVPPPSTESVSDRPSAPAASGPATGTGSEGEAVVVLPEAEPGGVVEVPEATEELAPEPMTFVASSPVAATSGAPPPHEKPAEMLARMVEPVDAVEASESDQADLRARLERTAALKKPGSKERREEGERFGGPEGPESP